MATFHVNLIDAAATLDFIERFKKISQASQKSHKSYQIYFLFSSWFAKYSQSKSKTGNEGISQQHLYWYKIWSINSGLLPEDVEISVIWPLGGTAISDISGDAKDKIWHRWSSNNASQTLSDAFFIFENIHPLQPNKRQTTKTGSLT